MQILAAAVLAGATLSGVLCLIMARLRVPKSFRSLRTSLAVSLPCLTSKHDECHLHLNCPCACHDDVLHFALLTDPQYTPYRPNRD